MLSHSRDFNMPTVPVCQPEVWICSRRSKLESAPRAYCGCRPDLVSRVRLWDGRTRPLYCSELHSSWSDQESVLPGESTGARSVASMASAAWTCH